MDLSQEVKKALDAGRRSLDEAESKILLSHYGIPTVPETMADTTTEALDAAVGYGYPIVLKGIAEGLHHKTEKGLVHLGLSDDATLVSAVEKIKECAPGARFLIQPYIRGSREFMAGLFRDPHFGPAISFGVGGVLTEALSDIAFRLAPIDTADVGEMIQQIRSRSLLGPFRGEDEVDMALIEKTLLGLSAMATAIPEIAEVDINPLIATKTGEILAVDALVTLAHPQREETDRHPVPPEAIASLFYPRSLAFVGASATIGKWGNMLICNTISGGYRGKIFAVNPNGGTIAGQPACKTVADIPDDVDLAVVTIPAKYILELIPQLKAKGIRYMLLVTSGFGETGTAGKRLEQELVAQLREAGITMIGPNTMGINNPHISFYCTGVAVRPLPGSTAMVAQSGNMGMQLLAFAEAQGIGIRGFCGSGNEAMIAVEDFLEGFEVDDTTRTVLIYLENVRQGRRFFESASRVSRKKPIVLLKGGQTRAGYRAAASHTGAMASDKRIFDAACRQAGIIKVDQPMELLDLAAAFSALPFPRGNRVAIMTLGGGWGVVTADLCSQFGLDVPQLPPAIVESIDRILPPFWSRANPVDIVGENDLSIPLPVMERLLAWEGCDAVINLGIFGRRVLVRRLAKSLAGADPLYTRDILDARIKEMANFEQTYISSVIHLMEQYDKPILGVSVVTEEKDATVYRVDGHERKALFYDTPEQAIKALAHMVEYQGYLTKCSGR